MSFENAESVAIELQQFVENDGQIYRQMTQPILKNLTTKKARGVYKADLAHKAFMNLAEAGAKQYVKQVGGCHGTWHTMFPIDVRRIVAKNWVESFETEYGYGNYDDFLPKKYQKKSK